MNILLFGVSNVGKSVSGRLPAYLPGCSFYDLDDEVKKDRNTTPEEFVSTGTLLERDEVRCRILTHLVCRSGNKVTAVTPLSCIKDIRYLFSSPDVMSIKLTDSAENIFDRLVFSDENDVVYKDDAHKNRHRDHCLKEIQADPDWHASVYSDIRNRFDISGRNPEETAAELINRFHLYEDTGRQSDVFKKNKTPTGNLSGNTGKLL